MSDQNNEEQITQCKDDFAAYVKLLQNKICEKLKALDPEIVLKEDIWQRKDFNEKPGGGGITRAFTGNHIENAGVNTSLIFGEVDPKFAANLKGKSPNVWATGISLIIHPRNPRVPTVHANFRMIHNGDQVWFGGGADLTPYYPYKEDFSHFHGVWKKVCDKYNLYDGFKNNCDEYFVNKHRNNEMRGVGGIFFDHFNSGDLKADLKMVQDFGDQFIDSYFPIAEIRYQEDFTTEDESFQLYRRGRYVEFNLLHDRGTMFGLKSNGRTESILISLPARCRFEYAFSPEENSKAQEMNQYYYPHDWA